MTPNQEALKDMRKEAARGSGQAEPYAVAAANHDAQGRLLALALQALERIRDLQPKPFEFPADHSEQIASCQACKDYERHPLMRGICNEHRRPFHQREAHDDREERRLGWEAKAIAREAADQLKSATPTTQGAGHE